VKPFVWTANSIKVTLPAEALVHSAGHRNMAIKTKQLEAE
jgi:hypothetical protein